MGLRGRQKVEAQYAPHRVLEQADALYLECLSAPARINGSGGC